MKMRTIAVVAGMLVFSALPAAAQEKPLPLEPIPSPAPAESPAACPADCPNPAIKVLWLEKDVTLQRIVPREVITFRTAPTMEVEYTEKKCKVTDIVLKPREVVREVACCTLQPETTTDPHTGKTCTVMKPVTQMKQVKEIEYVAVPEEREVTTRVPSLKYATKSVPHRVVLFEYRTEMRKTACPVPVADVVPTREYKVAPRPHCPCDP